MMNKKWKSFQKLTEKCYENMIGAEEDDDDELLWNEEDLPFC